MKGSLISLLPLKLESLSCVVGSVALPHLFQVSGHLRCGPPQLHGNIGNISVKELQVRLFLQVAYGSQVSTE